MVLAQSKNGQIFKIENGKYIDLKTNQAAEGITETDIIEVIQISFSVWQLIKQFWGIIKKLFKKK